MKPMLWNYAGLIVLIVVVSCSCDAGEGQWTALRGGGDLTNRTETKCRIQHPHIAWSIYQGPWTMWATLRAAPGEDEDLTIPADRPYDSPERFSQPRQSWALEKLYIDLLGDGVYRAVQPPWQEAKIARVLADARGMQKIRATEVRSPTDRQGHHTDLSLSTYEDNPASPRLLWKKRLYRFHERPHVLTADMTGDGQNEVIVSGWAGVVVFRATDGAQLMAFPEEELHQARKRGYVQARDLDGDGCCEIIIIGEVANHVDVLKNEGGKRLSVAWYKLYDKEVATQNRLTRSIPGSVDDFCNTGRFQVVYNLWNEHDDEQWHIKGVDALTGKELFDLPGAYLRDAIDLNSDGKLELLCVHTDTLAIPVAGTIGIYGFNSASHPEQISALDSAYWMEQLWVNDTPHIATHGGTARFRAITLTVDGKSQPAFLAAQVTEEGTTVRACHLDPVTNSVQATSWRIHAPQRST